MPTATATACPGGSPSWECELLYGGYIPYSGQGTKLFNCPSDTIPRTAEALAFNRTPKSYRCNGYLWSDADASCLNGAYLRTGNSPSNLISLIDQPYEGMVIYTGTASIQYCFQKASSERPEQWTHGRKEPAFSSAAMSATSASRSATAKTGAAHCGGGTGARTRRNMSKTICGKKEYS